MKILQVRTPGDWQVLVDDDDWERLHHFAWCINRNFNQMRVMRSSDHKYRQYLHWDVIGRPKPGLATDHINGNPLDNRKANLRHISQMENMNNCKQRHLAKGYSFSIRHKLWLAYWKPSAVHNSKRTNIGWFKTEEDAKAAVLEYRASIGEL